MPRNLSEYRSDRDRQTLLEDTVNGDTLAGSVFVKRKDDQAGVGVANIFALCVASGLAETIWS